jgi:hypothetical protein
MMLNYLYGHGNEETLSDLLRLVVKEATDDPSPNAAIVKELVRLSSTEDSCHNIGWRTYLRELNAREQ